MAASQARIPLTADELVRKQPGWKPQGEAAEVAEPIDIKGESSLPDFSFSKTFNFVSKNATLSSRQ